MRTRRGRGRFFNSGAGRVLAQLSVGALALTWSQAAMAATPAQASAAPAGGGSMLGEVVVTARKRSESLQTVPLSVTAASGTQLLRQGIRSLEQIDRVVPSLHVDTRDSSSAGTAFQLRGQEQTDFTLNVSNAVGVYEDQGNDPHPVGLQGALFDISRIEVLKGPQGTLYGRNTTGGAINIITRSADSRGYHGDVYGEIGNLDNIRAGGAINIPIVSDKLAVRLAYQHWYRQGDTKSLTTGKHSGDDRNDDTARLSIKFDPTSNFTSTTKVAYSHFDRVGFNWKPLEIYPTVPAGLPPVYTPAVTAGLLQFIQGAGYETYYRQTQNPFAYLGLPNGGPGGPPGTAYALGLPALQQEVANTNPYQNYTAINQFARTTRWHFVEDWTWRINDAVSMRSITSYHSIIDRESLSLDGTAFSDFLIGDTPIPQPFSGMAALTHTALPQFAPTYDFHQWTQEFDFQGQEGGLNWLLGFFGSRERGLGANPALVNPFYVNPLFALGFALPPGSDFIQQNDTYTTGSLSVYSQNDYHFTKNIFLTFGGRYTSEKQVVTNLQYAWNPFFPLGGKGANLCLTNFATVVDPNSCPRLSGDLHSHGLSYLLSLNFQITPDIFFYIKTSKGYRGGAIQWAHPDQQPALPETAKDYEIGVKSEFFDHRLRINLAAYQTAYSNKQVLTDILDTQTQNITSLILNAAKARIRGFEGEFSANPVEGWSIYGTVAYLNGVYQAFKNPVSLAADSVSLCQEYQGVANCIFSGIPFENPHWQYSIGSRYEHPVGPGVLGGQLDWSDHSHLNRNILNTSHVISAGLQDAYYGADASNLHAQLDFTVPQDQLTIALWMDNALDNQSLSGLAGAPSVGGFSFGHYILPRTFGVTVTKKFGAE
jgi:iron complex outermembrane receptor protein